MERSKNRIDHLKFLKELYLYLSSGFKIENSLKKIKNGSIVSEYIERGLELSKALRLIGFPDFIIQNIKIGEETGKLIQVLENLVNFLEIKANLEREVKFALITPLFSLISLFIFFLIVVVFVIPETSSMLAEFGIQTPKSIILIEKTKEYIQNNLLTSILFTGAILYIISTQIKKVTLFSSAQISVCTRALHICLDNGIELQKALILTSSIMPEKIRREMEIEAGRVLRGLTPSFSFVKDFQEDLLSSFERGELSRAFLIISNIYSERVKRQMEILKKAIEPTLFIITSLFLLFFVITVYLPILEKIREIM
jgi:type II secretory pathway component PulF